MSPNNDNNYLVTTVILLNQVINSSKVIEELCNPCIKNKHTKIINYKKMTLKLINFKRSTLTCKSPTIYLHNQEKLTLLYYIMNSPINHKSHYPRAKISSLILLNSSYYKPKSLVKKNLDIYKLIVEKSLLI